MEWQVLNKMEINYSQPAFGLPGAVAQPEAPRILPLQNA